jgi:hypothetical protein
MHSVKAHTISRSFCTEYDRRSRVHFDFCPSNPDADVRRFGFESFHIPIEAVMAAP